MKFVAGGLVVAGAILAAVLAAGQKPFAPSRFEFGVVRPYSGVLETSPVPVLWTQDGPLLLVSPGKHGATFDPGAHDHQVTLEGSLIERGSRRMIEIHDGSLAVGPVAPAVDRWQDAGEVELSGEVVDTKCFLGVMNPGEGKVHRACAARCIRGGVPAALSIGDRLVFLTGADLSGFAGERVTLRGSLLRAAALEVLRVDSAPR